MVSSAAVTSPRVRDACALLVQPGAPLGGKASCLCFQHAQLHLGLRNPPARHEPLGAQATKPHHARMCARHRARPARPGGPGQCAGLGNALLPQHHVREVEAGSERPLRVVALPRDADRERAAEILFRSRERARSSSRLARLLRLMASSTLSSSIAAAESRIACSPRVRACDHSPSSCNVLASSSCAAANWVPSRWRRRAWSSGHIAHVEFGLAPLMAGTWRTRARGCTIAQQLLSDGHGRRIVAERAQGLPAGVGVQVLHGVEKLAHAAARLRPDGPGGVGRSHPCSTRDSPVRAAAVSAGTCLLRPVSSRVSRRPATTWQHLGAAPWAARNKHLRRRRKRRRRHEAGVARKRMAPDHRPPRSGRKQVRLRRP